MMREFLVFITFLASFTLFGQVGIGTVTPDPSSQLDISATDKGVLIPRVSLPDVSSAMLDGVNPAAIGLLIYNTNALTTGGSGTGYYYYNGLMWERLTTSSAATGDHDFYEEGTTTAPNDITDDMYTQGNVAIGKIIADYPLDIESDLSIYGAQIQLGGATNDDKTGMFTRIVNTGTGTQHGYYTHFESNGAGIHYGIYNNFLSENSTIQMGMRNQMDNDSDATKYGTYNLLFGDGDGSHTGFRAQLTGAGSGLKTGVTTSISGTGGSNHFGIYNTLSGTGAGSHFGSRNQLTGTGTGLQYGTYNVISNSGNAGHYGVYSELSGGGNGPQYGTYTIMSNTGNSIKVGSDVRINGGTTSSIAGYQTTITAGTGPIHGFFSAISSNGHGPHRGLVTTVNGSGIGEHVGIRNILTGSGFGRQIGLENQLTNTGNGIHYGVKNELSGQGSGVHYGNFTEIAGSGSGLQYGVRNSISNSGNANHFGVFNNMIGMGSGIHYGTANVMGGGGTGDQVGLLSSISNSGNGEHKGLFSSLTGAGSGDKFAIDALILPTSGGTHYGVRSTVTKAGSFAGYFTGAVAIGTNAVNTYTFPASRGIANQVMQTDGLGNLSWVDTDSFVSVGNARNGLSLNGSFVELGGSLLQTTTINQGIYNMQYNLTGTGDFKVQNTGVDVFSVLDSGDLIADTDTFFLDADTDRIGIGTLNPAEKLHVVGDILLTGAARNIETQDGDQNIQLDDANPSWFGNAYGGVTRFYGDGTLALSKLEAGSLQLERNIQIKGGVPGVGKVLTSDAVGYATWETPSGGDISAVIAGDGLVGGATAGTATIDVVGLNGLTTNANDIRLGGSLTQNSTITAEAFSLNINLNNAGSGNFNVLDEGVNHFQVSNSGLSFFGGDTYWREGSTGGTNIAMLTSDGNDGRFAIMENGGISVDLDANTQFVFNEQGLDRNFRVESDDEDNMFFIDSGLNNIGIKTAVPEKNLQIDIDRYTGASGSGGVSILQSFTGNEWTLYTSQSSNDLAIYYNGTLRGTFSSVNGTYSPFSDRRMKKNIQDLEPVLDRILKMKPKKYHIRDQNSSEKKSIGVLAQEIEQLFPELVRTMGDDTNGNGIVDLKTVSYTDLIPVLIKGVQEQQEQLDAQSEKIEALEKMVKELLASKK